MKPIAFIDTEIDPKTRKILDMGGVRSDGPTFHSPSMAALGQFLSGAGFIAGHNIIHHDLRYIGDALAMAHIAASEAIDTLYLAPLLFPATPYHRLVKDDKLQTQDANNPLNDSVKARDLLYDQATVFHKTDPVLKHIFYLLLKDTPEFGAFFRWLSYQPDHASLPELILQRFASSICAYANLASFSAAFPIELAYSLALIHCNDRYSIMPPWVVKNFPDFERILSALRSRPCVTGCSYCNASLDAVKGLQKFFGFDQYRTYAGEPLQYQAVKAALQNKSLLAVFPTGGGKSITFQVPALMAGENTKSLTVVISPLQSLMKDQVDNLERIGITAAVTINGLLDPIERAESIKRVRDGRASIVYIAPESLRSKTIEKILLGRKIERFVIDEAHCFSSWGQDFRVDYLYIAEFIQLIQRLKNLDDPIPVSCLTATAKQKVIADICAYFAQKLGISLEVYPSKATRTNLQYQVFERTDDEKYNTVRDLIEDKNCPTILYVSRTARAEEIAQKLTHDGFNARAFHGRMPGDQKTKNQDAFIEGQVQIMVATSAFGMGVDKKDVGMVIHYEISDSLENYVQEAGRAGRDEQITADCYVLFNEEDLSKHFILLNQTKLNRHEIDQIWKAIKFITKFRSSVQKSPLEIARAAGWDDNLSQIEMRVTTAIAALEQAGYLRRTQNVPRLFANSIMTQTAQEAIDRIAKSEKFSQDQKITATRMIKSLFSSKSRKHLSTEDAESRVDYLADNLGINIRHAITVINLLRDEKILADANDLTAFVKKSENKNRSLAIVQNFSMIENFLCPLISERQQSFHLKQLNEQAEAAGCKDVSPARIKTILNFWAIKNWIKRHHEDYAKNHIAVIACQPQEVLARRIAKRHDLARFIVVHLYEKMSRLGHEPSDQDEIHVEFSVLELQKLFEDQATLFGDKATIEEVEEALFYLSRIEAIKIEGGFLVVYNRISIDRLETNNRAKYKVQDYEQLQQFYDHKVQQIHIVGEYAKKMTADYTGALQFVDDYFQLNFSSFLSKYFKGSRANEISRNITPQKYRQLFESLSTVQRRIIDDKESKHIVVAAGPGSGKTKVLVHKLAALLLMEDVKHEQLLMLTFSRAAATEFKKRLVELIGNAAHFVEIKTFHSFGFDLLGKVGTIDRAESVIVSAVEKINSGEVEASRITKTVLVIDEAQDMNADEFALIRALMDQNDDMRVIAVGDDDQNIYQWRGADSKYFTSFITDHGATVYELTTNYRSKSNLVSFADQFVHTIGGRLKSGTIVPNTTDDGQIYIAQYKSAHLIAPLVDDVLSTYLSGTTCILTCKNREAFQVAGLLAKCGRPARLIQSNEGFSLYNLDEIRFFIGELDLDDHTYIIGEDNWQHAHRRLIAQYQTSSRLEACLQLLHEFHSATLKKKYKSDLDAFIRESKLEDFIRTDSETILVSTIHKAKGKEFDNVFLLLDSFDLTKDDTRRQLYVAMTRARRTLRIHGNGSYFEALWCNGLKRVYDHQQHESPRELTLHLSHKDLNLGYFFYVQPAVSALRSGHALQVCEQGCKNERGQWVLKFSKQFIERVQGLQQLGFEMVNASVGFVVWWYDANQEQEVRIVLPKVCLERG